MALPLHSMLHKEVQHFLLLWDFRVSQSDFAPAHIQAGLRMQREWSWVMTETF